MNPDIKKRWLEALRSGEYRQAHGDLKTHEEKPRFCCLGVLCDLHAKETGQTWTDDGGVIFYLTNSDGVLPPEIVGWAGLSEADPEVVIEIEDDDDEGDCLRTCNRHEPLTQVNDDHGFDFRRIADAIEASL